MKKLRRSLAEARHRAGKAPSFLGRLLLHLYLFPVYLGILGCVALFAVVALFILAIPLFMTYGIVEWIWKNTTEQGVTLYVADMPMAYYEDKRGCDLAAAGYLSIGAKRVKCVKGKQ